MQAPFLTSDFRVLRVGAGLLCAAAFSTAGLGAAAPNPDYAAALNPVPIFSSGSIPGGISVPLPSLLVTKRGTVIAVAELRKPSPAGFDDFGHESDLIIRRSSDGGLSWGPVQVVYADPKVNAVNGPIVEDAATATIILPFSKVPAAGRWQADWVRDMTAMGGGIWTTTSADEGRSWSRPIETKPHGRAGWVAWPNNNSHGVQLANGRLVIAGMAHQVRPGEHFDALDFKSCLLLSDDHGRTWRIGALAPFYGTDELALALCRDGSVLASIRTNNRTPHDLVRLLARSRDGGESFAECWAQDNLSINACHAGMIQFVDRSLGYDRTILAHSGPQGGQGEDKRHQDRTRLTIRLSYDDGRTWLVSRLLFPGPINTEYSDLAIAPDGAILCLFSSHQHSPGGRVDLARFSLESVERLYSPLSSW